MGESVNVLEQLEKEITCSICRDHYVDPKVLPCCHYYCKKCISAITSRKDKGKLLSCPECRTEIKLPHGGVDKLQTAFFVNRIKDVLSKMEHAYGKVDARCEMCSGGKVEAFCRQCTQFICSECVNQHKRMKKLFSGHEISSLEDLKQVGHEDIICQESPVQSCQVHQEFMRIYCFDCNSLICRDCTVIDHKGHKFDFVRKAAPEMKTHLIKKLKPLKEVEKNISQVMLDIETTKDALKTQGKSIASMIESAFKVSFETLMKRKAELLQEAEVKVAAKLENLSSQEKTLTTTRVVIQSVLDYTKQCIEHSIDDEIMCIHAEIESRIDKEFKGFYNEGNGMEPVEEVDVEVDMSFVEEIKELVQTKALINHTPIDPIKSTATLEREDTAEIGEVSEACLTLANVLATGKRTKRQYNVECHLKSLVDDSIIKCDVKMIGDNKYNVQFTPVIRGRSNLIVYVDGQEVTGNPFPVFVSIPPTQLGDPVREFYRASKSHDIAADLDGEIIITEFRKLSVLSNKGKQLSAIDSSDCNIGDPVSVAADGSTNSVYFSDKKHNKIIWLNRETNAVKEVGAKANSKLFGLTIVGEKVMVCDSENDCILVYTKELDFVHEIGSHGRGQIEFNEIQDISSDQEGNLYISDKGNSRIQVLTEKGAFKNSIGCDEYGANVLSYPCGICVAGGHVYVTDQDNHNVSVYTTVGEYVTSFGQEGPGEGDFDTPWGVCIDKDGFVYVCDTQNQRVQVF